MNERGREKIGGQVRIEYVGHDRLRNAKMTLKLSEEERKRNKTGLQPVSRPVEQVPLLRGLWVGAKAS